MRKILTSSRNPEIPSMPELREHPAVITNFDALTEASDDALCVWLNGAEGAGSGGAIMTDAIATVRWSEGEDKLARLPTASFLVGHAVGLMPAGDKCDNLAASLFEVQQRSRELKELNEKAAGKTGVRTVDVGDWGVNELSDHRYIGPRFILDLSILDDSFGTLK